MKRLCLVLLVTLSACLGIACGKSQQASDSNTNWLRGCDSSKSCGDGSSCVCGVCTAPCINDTMCGRPAEPDAICAPIGPDACDGMNMGSVCLQSCDRSAQCADGLACVTGTCRQRTGASANRDAGARPEVDAASADDSGMDATLVVDSGDGAVVSPPVEPRKLSESCDDAATCLGGLSCERGTCQMPWSGLGCEPAQVNRPACAAGCADGTICHIDNTCIEPGKCDALGEATLAMLTNDADSMRLTRDSIYILTRPSTDRLGNVADDAAIVRLPLAGGPLETLVPAMPRAFGLSIDGTRMFWSGQAAGVASPPFHKVWAADQETGANPIELASGDIIDWEQAGTSLFIERQGSAVGDINLLRMAKSGGAEQLLASAVPAVLGGGILVDTSAVYLALESGGIMVYPHAGGTGRMIAVNSEVGSAVFGSLGDASIFHLDQMSGVVWSTPKDGGTALKLSRDINNNSTSFSPLVYREHVYFVSVILDGKDNPVRFRRAERTPGISETLAEMPHTNNTELPAFAVGEQGLFWTQSGRLIRKVITDYYPTPTLAQGEPGGPCFGDSTCNTPLSCVDTVCE